MFIGEARRNNTEQRIKNKSNRGASEAALGLKITHSERRNTLAKSLICGYNNTRRTGKQKENSMARRRNIETKPPWIKLREEIPIPKG
jgi:hypothetical protein